MSRYCGWFVLCCAYLLVVKAKLSYETKIPNTKMLNFKIELMSSESKRHSWSGPFMLQVQEPQESAKTPVHNAPYAEGAMKDYISAQIADDEEYDDDDNDGDGDDDDEQDAPPNSPRRGSEDDEGQSVMDEIDGEMDKDIIQ